MKKWIWVLVAIAFAVVARIATEESDAEVVARAKAQVQASCLRQGNGSDLIAADRLDAFCRCSADAVARELGPKGLRAMIDDRGGGDFDAARMAELSVQCFEDVVASLPPPRAAPRPAIQMPAPASAPASEASPGTGAKQAVGGRRGSDTNGG